MYTNLMASLVLTDSSQLTSDSRHLGIYSSPVATLVLTDSSQLTSDSQHLGIYSSPLASLVLTDSSQLTSDSRHLGIYSSSVASLVLTDSSQLTSDSQHLGIYSSPVASLVLTDSSQLTSDSQHLGIYSSPVGSLVLTDSSQPTSDSKHLAPFSAPALFLDRTGLQAEKRYICVAEVGITAVVGGTIYARSIDLQALWFEGMTGLGKLDLRSARSYEPPLVLTPVIRGRDLVENEPTLGCPLVVHWNCFGGQMVSEASSLALDLTDDDGFTRLANVLAVLSSTAEDGEIEVRISVG
uniref:Uncharacterized protein n=1 Tax=Timema douglasi TaxID=61478 RepID=A0A7R8ZC11_TIMDO|nr:unnamed protein product [Timema douglasi]